MKARLNTSISDPAAHASIYIDESLSNLQNGMNSETGPLMFSHAQSRPVASNTDSERLARLRLARSENVGPVTFSELLAHFGTAAAALEALPELAARGGRKKAIRIAGLAAAQNEMEAVRQFGAEFLILGDSTYPAALCQTVPPPPVICVKGHPHLLERPCVAIVGARNASASGARLASQLADGLGREGFTVVSGLARGIDAAAHRSSLLKGTIAVIAGGLDIIYPEEHAALQREISTQGLLVSEMPLGTQPLARYFPRRNRIISGLSMGVVVVEAALRSGSLITARFALEQNREVLAVPGSPLDPRCRGTNQLIKDGATLVETVDDIIEALSGGLSVPLGEPDHALFRPGPHVSQPPDASERRRVIQHLGPTPVEVDEIIRQTGLPVPTVRIILMELDLAGRLSREPGQRVAMVDTPVAGD